MERHKKDKKQQCKKSLFKGDKFTCTIMIIWISLYCSQNIQVPYYLYDFFYSSINMHSIS